MTTRAEQPRRTTGPWRPPVLLLRPIEAKHGDKSRANLLNVGF